MPTFFHGWDQFWRLGWPQNGPIQPQNVITCCLQSRESYLESFKCAISHPNTWDSLTRGHKSHFHTPIYGTRGPKLAYYMEKSRFGPFWGFLVAILDGKKRPQHEDLGLDFLLKFTCI